MRSVRSVGKETREDKRRAAAQMQGLSLPMLFLATRAERMPFYEMNMTITCLH